MSNNILAFPTLNKVEEVAVERDLDPVLTEYEALVQLRHYYTYAEGCEDKLNYLDSLLVDNIRRKFAFPIVPTWIYKDYLSLAIPNSLATSSASEKAFQEYAATCL